ncbi:MAG: ZIP family metal transporter [Anaerolineales bacterium]|uniref:ZIP family metal transporter n=1 Tax=Candidatus Desulfolinea nitratireducens TaxID=2841698 RepID=A0A8J6NJ56_9CHLR|nr:ZIP family metal transporter [Candidatus Desulfolinea nitratireducens]MBL6960015.1 ZIP family metal transporter [Anaerolineales bacterium]
MTEEKTNRFTIRTFGLLLLPIILLAGVIFLFLSTGGGLDLKSAAPVEDLNIERYTLSPSEIEIYVRNAGPEALNISTLIINDAVWPFSVSPSNTIPRLGQGTIHLEYPWVYGEAYGITLFTSNAVAFDVEIPVAFSTPKPSSSTFWSFALIGLYVGVIPVFLGIFWFPALRLLSRRWMIFLMAITAGLLIFLGLDTLIEALENAAHAPGSFQGTGLVGIGAVATFLLLDAISKKESRTGRNESEKRLSLAYMIAIGIGIHNLGEGLAIGAAYNIGEIALGTFLVVGFIIQNITEGLGIIAPVLRDRPDIRSLIWLGLIGGAPAILGAWIGGFSPSPTLATLFLAVGTGAIFEVVYEIAKLIQKDTDKQPMPMTVFSGVLTGMMLLWVTGLLIK